MYILSRIFHIHSLAIIAVTTYGMLPCWGSAQIVAANSPLGGNQCASFISCNSRDTFTCVKTDAQRCMLLTPNVFRGYLVTEEQSLQLIADIKDVNVLSYYGAESPLSVSIARGHTKAVAALLKKGANPLATDSSGNLLLNHAIQVAWNLPGGISPEVIESLRLVLDSAKKEKQLLFSGRQPIETWRAFYSHEVGNTQVNDVSVPLLRLLFEYGADPMYGVQGKNAIYLAVYHERADALHAIISGEIRPEPVALDKLAFDMFVKSKSQMLETLRAGGADPKRYARDNPQAMLDALKPESRTDILEFVLQSGANPNGVKDGKKRIPPAFVARLDEDKLRLLLKYGADPNIREREGGYTLLAQVLFGTSEMEISLGKTRHVSKHNIVQLLLDAGANPNGNQNGWGEWGALGFTKRDEKDVIALLVARGATFTETDEIRRKRMTSPENALPLEIGPLTIAINLERDDLALALLNHNKKIYPQDRLALPMAARRGARELVQALLTAGADPNVADENGVTAIAEANRRHDDVMQKMLADAGAKPAAQPLKPRIVYSTGSAFANDVAREIDDVALFDPPRYRINFIRKDESFIFNGKDLGQIEEIKCEQNVGFGIVAFANEAANIKVGICKGEARHVSELVANSKPTINALFKQLLLGGGESLEKLTQMGWVNSKEIAKNGAEVHRFLVIQGLGGVWTVVVIPRNKQKAIVVQADIYRLCSMEGLQAQTPLCSDTRQALTDIALRIDSHFVSEVRR